MDNFSQKAGISFLLMFGCAAMPLSYGQTNPIGAKLTNSRPQDGISTIYRKLNLTDDQKKQLEANKQQHRAEMQAAKQQMKAVREAFRQELMKPQLDMAKINELHDQLKTLLGQMEDNKLKSILAVRNILTPEQFAKFIALMRQRHPDHDHD